MEIKPTPLGALTNLFIKKSHGSSKYEVNTKSFKTLVLSGTLVFVIVTILLPTEENIEFTEKIAQAPPPENPGEGPQEGLRKKTEATNIWSNNAGFSTPHRSHGSEALRAPINHNTSMLLGGQNRDAKVQLHSGRRVALRILDKFIVAQEMVPILAESILPTISDSGLRLPAGTRFYGESSFQKGSDRASIVFRQISLPSGETRKINALALGKDGQPGVVGAISSDRWKNTAGSLVTTFVAGYASGSMETNVLGVSKGGVENGLKAAIAATAKEQTTTYGEKLKTQREWMEVAAGTECDALLTESLNLQQQQSERDQGDSLQGEP